jgi:hypothetical protein
MWSIRIKINFVIDVTIVEAMPIATEKSTADITITTTAAATTTSTTQQGIKFAFLPFFSYSIFYLLV